MTWIARWTQPNFHRKATQSGLPQLITIPYSHYVEFARWALQYTDTPFQETPYAPMQHVLPVMNIRLGGTQTFLSNTQRVQPVARTTHEKERDARDSHHSGTSTSTTTTTTTTKKGGFTSVPVCVMPDGSVWVDSWDIAAFAFSKTTFHTTPSNTTSNTTIHPKLQTLLDQKVAPLTRQLAYYYMLKPSNKCVWYGLCTDGNHSWIWKLLWNYLGVGSMVTQMLANVFATKDTKAVQECRSQLKSLFEQIELDPILDLQTRMSKRKQDAYDMTDLALAALVAPIVLPLEYCEGHFYTYFHQLENIDPELQEELNYWRSTKLGQFCINMYKERKSYLSYSKIKHT